MGLCLPEECNADNHKAIVNTLNLALSQFGPDYYVGNIVDNPYAFEAEKKWLFYPVVILIITLMLLTLISTYLSRIPKFKDNSSTAIKIINTFNLFKSFKIFKHKHNVFNVFNGVKSLCMFWVILGHQYLERTNSSINFINI